ncbi:MAG: glutathione S-transferase family protein [Chitinophagaceae bacterium]|nr:glutathione S-transferase family protein [Oligoflexus sp.]
MLTLNQYQPDPKKPDVSIFCSKVEMFLKTHDLPYEGRAANPTKAPKGKLPTLSDGENLIADSDIIIRYLCDKFKIDPEPGLTAEQKALSFFIRKTLEEHYYFIMLHTRWVDPAGWSVANALFFSELPMPLRLVVPGIVRNQVKKGLYAQGIGRHEAEEIDRRGVEVLDHLVPLMGKTPFIFGDEPTLVDCVVFPILWGAFNFPSDSALKRAVNKVPEFRAYVDHIQKRYYH